MNKLPLLFVLFFLAACGQPLGTGSQSFESLLPTALVRQVTRTPSVLDSTPVPTVTPIVVDESVHIVFDRPDRTDGRVDEISQQVANAFYYTGQRWGSRNTSAVTVQFTSDGTCNLHGETKPDQHLILINICPLTMTKDIVAIAAHESGHQYCYDLYGTPHMNADMILIEGTAEYIAGQYTIGATARGTPVLYPMIQTWQAHDDVPYSIERHNALYREWASFVEYLITTYGREKFDQVYISGDNAPGSAKYQDVYGKTIQELEQDWLAWNG
jgi:hypothetical protein